MTTFQSNSLKSPFTADQIKVFKKSSFQSHLTVCCLAFAIFPFIFISSASYIAFVAATKLTPAEQAGISGSVGIVSSVAINMLSLCITGINPNCSKDADNAKQNTIMRVKETYNELAEELMHLHATHPKFAKCIAREIDLNRIKQAARQNYLNEGEVKAIFKRFKDAVKYINKERSCPHCHELRKYIPNYL